MKAYPLTALVLLAVGAAGCLRSPGGGSGKAFPTVKSFQWEGSRFTLGMTREDARNELRNAVDLDEFDADGPATIIMPPDTTRSDVWVLQCVSAQPVGPEAIVKLTFENKGLAKIEIVSNNKSVRRAAHGYPSRDELQWGKIRFTAGMTKAKAMEQLGHAVPENRFDESVGGVVRPADEELQSDVWQLRFFGPACVGNAARARLTFSADRLSRIQITAELP